MGIRGERPRCSGQSALGPRARTTGRRSDGACDNCHRRPRTPVHSRYRLYYDMLSIRAHPPEGLLARAQMACHGARPMQQLHTASASSRTTCWRMLRARAVKPSSGASSTMYMTSFIGSVSCVAEMLGRRLLAGSAFTIVTCCARITRPPGSRRRSSPRRARRARGAASPRRSPAGRRACLRPRRGRP